MLAFKLADTNRSAPTNFANWANVVEAFPSIRAVLLKSSRNHYERCKNWTAEKEYVMSEMKLCIAALRECEVLPPSFKETTIKIGVVSKFR